MSSKVKESSEAAKLRQESSSSSKSKSTTGSATASAPKSGIGKIEPSVQSVNANTVVSPKKVNTNTRKLTYDEKKELSKLEKEIKKIELQIKDVRMKLQSSDGSEGYSVLAEWSKEEQKLVELLESKEMKWLELSELES